MAKSGKYGNKTDLFYLRNKMVGAYIPIPLADHLALHCLVSGEKRQAILLSLIKEFLSKQKSESKLLSEIVTDLMREWNARVNEKVAEKAPGWGNVNGLTNRWEEFKAETRHNLNTRKISIAHINEILKRMENRL